MIVFSFTCWDFYLKEVFYGWVVGDEEVQFWHVAFGYLIAFGVGFLASRHLAKMLKIDGETDVYSGHE